MPFTDMNLPDSYQATVFGKTERDKYNERANREVKEVHDLMHGLYMATMRGGKEETLLQRRLHAVCATMPTYTADTPHVEEPQPRKPYFYMGVHNHSNR